MPDYTDELSGRRVVLTGSVGIIGTWIAEAFAAAGADLLLTDTRTEPLAELAKRLDARHVTADLTAPDGVDRLFGAVAGAWDAPDAVVNNAGIYPRTPVLGTDRATAEAVMDVNVIAPFLIMQRAIAMMIDAGVRGSIVNISSGAAHRPGTGGSVYPASKAAVEIMTKGIALEVAQHGIRVNAVSPGFAPGSEVSELPKEHVEKMLRQIPLGRTSGPGDSPSAVLWLCSDAASFVTGTTIAVDGGRTAGDYSGPPATVRSGS